MKTRWEVIVIDKTCKIAGETTVEKDGDPIEVVVDVDFDLDSNQISFYTNNQQGGIDLHLDKEDLKRLLAIFDEVTGIYGQTD